MPTFPRPIDGFISKSASLPVSVSLRMRVFTTASSCAKHLIIDFISYNIFAINLASVMIGYVYGSGSPYFADVNLCLAHPVDVMQILHHWR